MRTWQGLDTIQLPFPASTVAIGTFDGVHLGHQALIGAAVADARASGRPSVVFTFDRHPAEVIAPSRAPEYLTTPKQRVALIESLGVDELVVARFDDALRRMPPGRFLSDVIAGRLSARALFVGADFRFGHDHTGDVRMLMGRQGALGYGLTVIEPVMVGGERVSSTRIRDLLHAGAVEAAAAMLGRPYALEGVVVEGQKLGRQLGYPTANLELPSRLAVPADGVYAARATWPGGQRDAALSIGTRPTVGGTRRAIEAYLLDFDGDLYGQTLSVEVDARVRGQVRFASVAELVEQMGRDVSDVRDMLAHLRPA